MVVGYKNRLFAGLLGAFVGCMAQPIYAFGFDDLEKVEKVEKKERHQREARAEAARREEEARRQAQQQAEESRQRAATVNSGGGSNRGTAASTEAGGRYSIYRDKGRAAAWEWFKQEIIVTCEGGKKNGSMPSIYLRDSGQWSTTYSGTFSTFHAAATAACEW